VRLDFILGELIGYMVVDGKGLKNNRALWQMNK